MYPDMKNIQLFIRIGEDIIESYLKNLESGGEVIEIPDSDDEVL